VKTIDDLRRALAALDLRLAGFDAECRRTSGHAVNPDNEIGGMRSRSARAKGRLLARWDAQARESRRLYIKRQTLVNRIAWLEAAPIRDRNDALALAAWDALAVGDPFPLRPDSLTIIKKNRGSIRTSLGTVWTCEEVTGLSPARVRELRDRMEPPASPTLVAPVVRIVCGGQRTRPGTATASEERPCTVCDGAGQIGGGE